MLFNRYHVVVFKDNQGHCKKISLHGWFFASILVLILSLSAGNIYLWKYYHQSQTLEQSLADSEKTIFEQNSQILSMVDKLRIVQKDLQRVQQFDTKLRIMINLDKDQGDTASAVGGAKTKDFADNYPPIHRQELLARKIHSFLKDLNTEVRLEEVSQQELLQTFRKNQRLLAATPSIWPTEGWVASPFGPRRSPFTGRKDFHKGIDVANRIGTPIYSTANGRVSFTGSGGGYGINLMINHGSGVITRYAHLNRYVVKKGQKVKRGELVGYMGNTGRSTGPHLHYEVKLNGVALNPKKFILN